MFQHFKSEAWFSWLSMEFMSRLRLAYFIDQRWLYCSKIFIVDTKRNFLRIWTATTIATDDVKSSQVLIRFLRARRLILLRVTHRFPLLWTACWIGTSLIWSRLPATTLFLDLSALLWYLAIWSSILSNQFSLSWKITTWITNTSFVIHI
jgi:hypothetical protein